MLKTSVYYAQIKSNYVYSYAPEIQYNSFLLLNKTLIYEHHHAGFLACSSTAYKNLHYTETITNW